MADKTRTVYRVVVGTEAETAERRLLVRASNAGRAERVAIRIVKAEKGLVGRLRAYRVTHLGQIAN